HVGRLVHLGERVGELTPAPVFQAMHTAATGGNHALVALDHRGHLLALIRMHEKYDLVMPHDSSLRMRSRPSRGAARCGKEIYAGGNLPHGIAPRFRGGAKDTQSRGGVPAEADAPSGRRLAIASSARLPASASPPSAVLRPHKGAFRPPPRHSGSLPSPAAAGEPSSRRSAWSGVAALPLRHPAPARCPP